jgi:hypothetical protein
VTFEDVRAEHVALLQDYTIASNVYKTRSESQSKFLSWLTKTIDSDIWTAIIAALQARTSIPVGRSFTLSSPGTLTPAQTHRSIQEILRSLKHQYAPSSTTVETAVRETYKKVLADGAKGAVNQERWYSEWRSAYENAKLYAIPEIYRSSGIKDFLEYVSLKMQPR